jgi:hypothetical protein
VKKSFSPLCGPLRKKNAFKPNEFNSLLYISSPRTASCLRAFVVKNLFSGFTAASGSR